MNKVKDNQLRTKQDLAIAFEQIVEPLDRYYTKEMSAITFGYTGAGYDQETIGVEAFLRLLWGMAPLVAGKQSTKLLNKQRQGIITGTDPSHPGYWGKIYDYDQRIVEMASLGFSLLLAPEHFWEPLTKDQQENVANWLNQINHVKAHDCNWLFFAVIVNMGLKKVGAFYDQNVMDRHLDRIDDFYLGEGWYQDGEVAHRDYYGPFAIHFYSLIYAKMMEKDDPHRANKYKERAKVFGEKFIYWFAEDGRAIPYGRSLTYRFSQVAFWSAYVFAEVEGYSYGVTKGIILRHLRYWFKQSIFNGDGTLSIGYHYPNLIMAENYNSPGSPYWSLKSLLILALPEDHPFWLSEEVALPSLRQRRFEPRADMMIERDQQSDHVVLFPNGNAHTNSHTHTAAKYEKFAYSNHFGFSVSRAEFGLDQGAFDSMLALSEGDGHYRVKRQVVEKKLTENYLFMKWKPWFDVTIKSWVIPGPPWHVRVHRIETGRKLDIADGGFAVGTDQHAVVHLESDQYALASYKSGTSAVKSLLTKREVKPKIIVPNSNTNIMTTNTAIPTITDSINPGVYWFCHAFYGSPLTLKADEKLKESPILHKEKSSQSAYIEMNNKQVFSFLFD